MAPITEHVISAREKQEAAVITSAVEEGVSLLSSSWFGTDGKCSPPTYTMGLSVGVVFVVMVAGAGEVLSAAGSVLCSSC